MKRTLFFIIMAAGLAGTARAQNGAPPTTDQMVEVDPIRCWWKTSEGAVRIGETFELTLTCAVLDNELVQVVPDESRLAGAVISMAPFEILGSSHPQDLRRGARRFFQYQYVMRIINPDAIGTDVGIPIITLHYRVNSKIAANASLQGRDLTYVLPPQPVRVLSLVTADAPDIRDSSDAAFDSVEALRLRAGVLQILATTLAVLGGLMIVAVLVRGLRGVRKGKTVEHVMSDYTVLRHAGRELADVQRASASGWNDTLAARALAATRIAAAVALGKRLSQRPINALTQQEDGKLITGRVLGRGGMTLSSPVTAEDVARAHARLATDADPARRRTLDDLQSAMTGFGQLQYGRGTTPDRTALDAALSSAIAANGRLKSANMWPKPVLKRMTARATIQPEHQT